MTSVVLVLLLGDGASVFSGPLGRSLPVAFPEGAPLVVTEAEPDATPALFVTVDAQLRRVDVVAVQSGLTRRLDFAAGDAVDERATATAFLLKAMLTPPAGVVDEPLAAARLRLSGRLVGTLAAPGDAVGGGLIVEAEWALRSFLGLGGAVDVVATSLQAGHTVQPSLLAVVTLRWPIAAVDLRASVGGGLLPLISSQASSTAVTAQPLGRLALGVDWRLTTRHAVSLLLGVHLTPALEVRSGRGRVEMVGPLWPRVEAGYQATF